MCIECDWTTKGGEWMLSGWVERAVVDVLHHQENPLRLDYLADTLTTTTNYTLSLH